MGVIKVKTQKHPTKRWSTNYFLFGSYVFHLSYLVSLEVSIYKNPAIQAPINPANINVCTIPIPGFPKGEHPS